MKLCFPVEEIQGLESKVYEHFGSAPAFIIVDSETNELKAVSNGDLHHTHGMCSPLKALRSEKVGAVIVGGIGAGALARLNEAGISVYRAMTDKVNENINLFLSIGLPVFRPELVCARHKDSCTNH